MGLPFHAEQRQKKKASWGKDRGGTESERGGVPEGLAARVGKERLSATRRVEDLVARIGKGVGDEELAVCVGNGRRRQEELVARVGQGVGSEEGVVARVGERRRRRGELVARVGSGVREEEGLVARVGKGAGGEEELGLESAKTRQCGRKK